MSTHSFTPTSEHAHKAFVRLTVLSFAFIFIALSVALDSDFHTAATDGVETTRTITWALKLDGESATKSCDRIDEFISGTQTEESTKTCDTDWHDLCQSVRWTLGLGFGALSMAFILNLLQWAYYQHCINIKDDKDKVPSKKCNLFVKHSRGGKLTRHLGQGILGLLAWALFVAHGISVHILLVECTDMPYPTTLYLLSFFGNLALLYYGVASIADSFCCFSTSRWSSFCGDSGSSGGENPDAAAGFY